MNCSYKTLHSFYFHFRKTELGVSAITCFLHACRHQNESKSRKYLAKVLWLLTYDDEKSSLAEAVDKYCVGVPPIQWLPWWVYMLGSSVTIKSLTCHSDNHISMCVICICISSPIMSSIVFLEIFAPFLFLPLLLSLSAGQFKTGRTPMYQVISL